MSEKTTRARVYIRPGDEIWVWADNGGTSITWTELLKTVKHFALDTSEFHPKKDQEKRKYHNAYIEVRS